MSTAEHYVHECGLRRTMPNRIEGGCRETIYFYDVPLLHNFLRQDEERASHCPISSSLQWLTPHKSSTAIG